MSERGQGESKKVAAKGKHGQKTTACWKYLPVRMEDRRLHSCQQNIRKFVFLLTIAWIRLSDVLPTIHAHTDAGVITENRSLKILIV